jgi:ATPase subunit of ABC transporter with duplicated ATPase domains
MREQQERQERLLGKGSADGREANQAKILLGGQKNRSQNTTGKLRQRHAAQGDLLSQNVREAAQMVGQEVEVAIQAWTAPQSARQSMAKLDSVELPYVVSVRRVVSLTITGRQRIGLLGANGCGKSTLLKVIAGLLPPQAGHCEVIGRVAYLDQRLAQLDPQRSAIEHLLAANPAKEEAELRTRLAQIGLDAERAARPTGLLSGGERLKAALACALYAHPPVQLLLLDEPSNHLDLASIEALEAMLRQYQGALVVASHDQMFMDTLDLTHSLSATH